MVTVNHPVEICFLLAVQMKRGERGGLEGINDA
jgi:hypothetical protein